MAGLHIYQQRQRRRSTLSRRAQYADVFFVSFFLVCPYDHYKLAVFQSSSSIRITVLISTNLLSQCHNTCSTLVTTVRSMIWSALASSGKSLCSFVISLYWLFPPPVCLCVVLGAQKKQMHFAKKILDKLYASESLHCYESGRWHSSMAEETVSPWFLFL